MSLTPREAFKFGFLSRCVEHGLSLDQVHQQVKEALDKLAGWTDLITKPAGAAAHGVASMSPYAMAGLAAAPLAIGGLGGFGLAKAVDVNERDADEVKRDEVTDEYERQTDLLRRVKAIRDAKQSRKRSGRLLM